MKASKPLSDLTTRQMDLIVKIFSRIENGELYAASDRAITFVYIPKWSDIKCRVIIGRDGLMMKYEQYIEMR